MPVSSHSSQHLTQGVQSQWTDPTGGRPSLMTLAISSADAVRINSRPVCLFMGGLLLTGGSQGAEHKREGCGQLILGGEGAAELLGQRRDDLAGVLRRDVDGDQEIGVQITSGAQAAVAEAGAVPVRVPSV